MKDPVFAMKLNILRELGVVLPHQGPGPPMSADDVDNVLRQLKSSHWTLKV